MICDPPKLQFFYDHNNIAGWGWLNDAQFVYALYTCDMNADTERKIEKELVIKTDKIKISPYIKKEKE
jgi:hypothetical protein